MASQEGGNLEGKEGEESCQELELAELSRAIQLEKNQYDRTYRALTRWVSELWALADDLPTTLTGSQAKGVVATSRPQAREQLIDFLSSSFNIVEQVDKSNTYGLSYGDLKTIWETLELMLTSTGTESKDLVNLLGRMDLKLPELTSVCEVVGKATGNRANRKYFFDLQIVEDKEDKEGTDL